MFRYADHEPVPLDFDIVDCIEQVSKAAVALCKCDEKYQSHEAKMQDRVDSMDECSGSIEEWLSEIGATRSLLRRSRFSDELRMKLIRCFEDASLQLQDSLDSLRGERKSTLDLKKQVAAIDASARDVLATLLNSVEVPGLTWLLDWKHGFSETTAQCQVTAAVGTKGICSLTPRGVIPSRPRVSDLLSGVKFEVPMGKSGRTRRVNCDKWMVTAFRTFRSSAILTLSRSRKSGDSLRIKVYGDGQQRAVVLTGQGGTEEHDGRYLSNSERVLAQRLIDVMSNKLAGLVNQRLDVVELEHVGRENDERWSAIADRLLSLVQPWAREVHERAGGGAELLIKRDMPGGRREERFLRLSEIEELIGELSGHYQELIAQYLPIRVSEVPGSSRFMTAPDQRLVTVH